MSRIWTAARIRQEMDQLSAVRNRLTQSLARGAEQLAATGAVPHESLWTELTDYRQQLRSLTKQMSGQSSVADTRLSLTLLEDQFQKSQRFEELVRQLDRIADLQHVDEPNYAPLARCREDARRCQQRLTSVLEPVDSEQTRLLAREHELQAVLALSDPGVDLTDEEWNRFQELVARIYGRGFSIALARGRIRYAATTERSVAAEPVLPLDDMASFPTPVAILPQPTVETVPAEAFDTTSMATESDIATRWFSSSSSVLPGVALAEMHQELAATEAVVTESTKGTAESASPPIDLQLPKPTWHTDPAAKLAREILAESPRTAARANALVRQLVRDDRVALAAHLARCGERFSSGSGMVPSAGLLRALLLGPLVSYSRGELAREVEQELKLCAPAAPVVTSGDDELLGVSLLQRAAALLPALLGASASATAVLRSFAIEPGLSHLYNYCSRVAAFGERLQSRAVELFQAPAEQTQWLAERKQLQAEAREWLDSSVKRGVTYQRSSPLFLHAHWTLSASSTQRYPHTVMEWAKWQEVLLLAHRLLRPLVGGTADRNDVRTELSRAAAMLQAENLEKAAGRPGNGRGLMTLTRAMQDLLQEAIDFANRWLRLQSSAPALGAHFAPQQAEELRTELLDRTTGVVAELDVVAKTRSADIVQTGVCACRRMIEQIRRLCDGEVCLALHEPDARHALYGEFLKMPHLELDENWQPVAELAEQEQAILEHLSSGWTDGISAFALQCHQEDHVASARVLELPIWSDAEVQSELRRVRGLELSRCRQSVLRELDELVSQIAIEAQDRPELQGGADELNLRLERLRASIPQLQTFTPLRARLDRYRERWRRLGSGDVQRADAADSIVKDDSAILPALVSAVKAETEASAALPTNAEQWVFLEE